MGVIYILITVSVFVALTFFVAFIYAVKTGQFEDSYTPSVRILFDDEIKVKPQDKSKTNK